MKLNTEIKTHACECAKKPLKKVLADVARIMRKSADFYWEHLDEITSACMVELADKVDDVARRSGDVRKIRTNPVIPSDCQGVIGIRHIDLAKALQSAAVAIEPQNKDIAKELAEMANEMQTARLL